MVQQVQTSLFFSLADPVCRKILTYAPETSLFLVAKQFSQLQEKAKETEWNRLKGRFEAVVFATERERDASEGTVLRANRAQWDKPFTSDLLKRLHEGQKEEAIETQKGREAFLMTEIVWQRYFGAERFEAAEAVVRDVRQELNTNLKSLWFWLKNPLHYAGPPLNHAREIHAWMSDPAHEADLDRIEVLALQACDLTVLSPELAHCRNLKDLKLRLNTIRDFPALKELKQLESIDLRYNQLEYVPEELLDLSRLNVGGVHLDDNPLKVLPEKLYDQFYTWLYWLSTDPMDGKPYNSCLNDWFGEEGFLQFSTSQLEEIPFSMWLRNRLYIPNLGEHFFEFVDSLLGNMHRNDWDFAWFASTIASVILLLTTFALWLPCYLINRLLALAAVPVITKIRELLGYGRMIRINLGEL